MGAEAEAIQSSPRFFPGSMLSRIQRFRTVSHQPFLNRGTVRRGGLGVGSILRFAFELKNMLLHIFRLEAKASAEAAGGKGSARQEPRALALDGLRI